MSIENNSEVEVEIARGMPIARAVGTVEELGEAAVDGSSEGLSTKAVNYGQLSWESLASAMEASEWPQGGRVVLGVQPGSP